LGETVVLLPQSVTQFVESDDQILVFHGDPIVGAGSPGADKMFAMLIRPNQQLGLVVV
jgi:hypothetical protein